jgi:4-diphosphocytidyl-2-C-methyl-D-erythritol kinase
MPKMNQAFAKINLGLFVLNKRPDGFHDLLTVFHRINLADQISIEVAPRITVASSTPDAPSDESNLCFKAASLLQERLGSAMGAAIRIQKKIPVGAGLGGGSADAAFVLRALPEVWGYQLPESQLHDLALRLGSDVPYFLGHGSAVARGRGEVLSYFSLSIPYTVVLCSPNIHVSTAWAYRHITPRALPTLPEIQKALVEGMHDPVILREEICNDFEKPVFAQYPAIRDIKETMMREGAVFALMSGSGSSVYGFFAEESRALAATHRFDDRGYKTFLTEPFFSPP